MPPDPETLQSLDECRQRIDELDRELVGLLNERAKVSLRVGRLKKSDGGPVYSPEREAQVIANVLEASDGPLGRESLQNIWAEILASSRALQRRLRVAYLGPVATFSYEAALRRFGRSAEFVPCRTIADVFHTTARHDVDFGVVPVENSTDGGVDMTLDAFVESTLKACAEIELPIGQHLMSRGRLEDITLVYSQPVALGQCRRWLATNLPRAEIVEVSSTARAVEIATEPHAAGIGPESASEVYGIPILVRHIEDHPDNFTRFLVIGERPAEYTGNDKTAIVFGVRHETGALHNAMGILVQAGLNLTRIESRPSKRQPWEYVFFIDFQGHQQEERVKSALADLRRMALFVNILGSWPAPPR